ncbi:MAG TPA: cation-translocating P-type ATPase, partial [Clostridiales bacterium]|nr:cation-translocating P-type ATPase [Clostridiales bacterium]
FARVLPLHKMRIVKALKEAGEVVAMIGDGVNDSPALKIADVGIAMGKHGSQVCREASDLILLDDNISTILEAIHDGRRIYQNICKTLGYIIAIHLPIALISFFAPLLSIDAKNLLLLPLHIILIELVMNPICSVVLERQPADDQIMFEKPRNPNVKLLSKGLMLKSTLQGLILFITVFLWYYLLLEVTSNGEIARTAGFFVLVLSNINLILVNCSDKESIVRSWNKIRKDKGILLVNLLTITITTLLIYTPIHSFFAFSPLPLKILIISILLSFLSVGWYEIVKLFQRKIDKNIKKQS